MHRIEYELTLSTGERIKILELDPGAVPELLDEEVMAAADPVVSRCPRVRRQDLEDAKRGHTKRLEAVLGTPPIGHLLMMASPVCGEVGTCSSADRSVCTTRNSAGGRPFLGRFPICWEFDVNRKVSRKVGPRASSAARELASHIVNAWREDRRVFVVTT